MKKISFLLIFVLIISCDKKKQEDIITIEEDVLKEDIIYKPNTESCEDFSKEMKQFISVLGEDNYALEYTKQDSLDFQIIGKDFDVEEKIVFYKKNFKSFKVKRISPIKNTTNMFPRFYVSEICFDSPEETKKIAEKITKIINNSDLFNDKNYDYVVVNNNRIIYVCCEVKMFEEYTFSYKPKLEQIIQNEL